MSGDYRKIIHIDMDAFYAAVEQRDNPDLRGKPIAVGWDSIRSVVSTASYEARKFGVHSALPSMTAKQRCPHLIFVPPRFEVYKEVSMQLREIFAEYTDLIEPLSLDEAFLDVTQNKPGIPSATQIAKEIKHKIKQRTKLTGSAGISINKFLAKIASDFEKPDGLTVIKPKDTPQFLKALPIEKFFGVGKVTAARMKQMSIHTGADLLKFSEYELSRIFGKAGLYYYQVVRGFDDRPVSPERVRKSVGAENTFQQDLVNDEELLPWLNTSVERVVRHLKKSGVSGKTVTVKIKYHDFEMNTRSKTVSRYINTYDDIQQIAEELLIHRDKPEKPIRLLGVSLSNLDTEIITPKGIQLDLPFKEYYLSATSR